MLRVAAYCRVSTSQEDQRNSLENQRRYFSEYISRQPDWELVEVYADEGLSGTSSDRPAFRRMLAAAAEEKIDLILTKEVSRLTRSRTRGCCAVRESVLYSLEIISTPARMTVNSGLP